MASLHSTAAAVQAARVTLRQVHFAGFDPEPGSASPPATVPAPRLGPPVAAPPVDEFTRPLVAAVQGVYQALYRRSRREKFRKERLDWEAIGYSLDDVWTLGPAADGEAGREGGAA